MTSEGIDCIRREGHGAAALLRLWGRETWAILGGGEGASYRERSGLEVDVLPFEAQ